MMVGRLLSFQNCKCSGAMLVVFPFGLVRLDLSLLWFTAKKQGNLDVEFLVVLHRDKDSANKITWNLLVKSTSMSELSCIFLRCWDFPILNHHVTLIFSAQWCSVDASRSHTKSGEIHRSHLKKSSVLLRNVILHIRMYKQLEKTQNHQFSIQPHWPCHIKIAHIMTWHVVFGQDFFPTPWLLAACLTTTHCIRPATGRNKSLEKDRSFKGQICNVSKRRVKIEHVWTHQGATICWFWSAFICFYLYILSRTNDPCFGWKRLCFEGLTFKNRGHLGSR